MSKKITISDRISNGINSALSVVAPKAALERHLCREQYKVMAGTSYKGAGRSRLNSDWNVSGKSADDDLLRELPTLRARSRDLIRNDGVASGAIDTLVNNIVGMGISPQSKLDSAALGVNADYASELGKAIEKVWKRWAESKYCDAGNRLSFYQHLDLAERQRFSNGEHIVVPLKLNDPYRPYSLSLLHIESDRLMTPRELRSDKSIKDGIRLGKNGEPLSYFISKSHPGDVRYYLKSQNNYIEYNAFDNQYRPNLFHLYHVKRAGQSRGAPFLAPVLHYFKDRSSFMEAELIANRIAACFALFIKKNNPMDGFGKSFGESEDSEGRKIETIKPGMVEYGEPGEELQVINPNRPGGAFEPFMTRILRDISAALDIPYEVLAKDFSRSNYSNTRAALMEARRFFQQQQKFLTQDFCQPVLELLIEEAYLKGELPILDFYNKKEEYLRVKWIPSGWGWIDPSKEVKASVEAVNNNLSTLSEEFGTRGKDWEEEMEQIAKEAKKKKDLEEKYGVKLDKLENNKNDEVDKDESDPDDDK